MCTYEGQPAWGVLRYCERYVNMCEQAVSSNHHRGGNVLSALEVSALDGYMADHYRLTHPEARRPATPVDVAHVAVAAAEAAQEAQVEISVAQARTFGSELAVA